MIKNGLVSLIFGLVGGLFFVVFHNMIYRKTIAVVKVDEIISSHLQDYGKKNISDDNRKNISESFSRALESVIQKVSKEENLTLLVAPAVVTSAPDYTNYIKRQVTHEMGRNR